MREMIYRNLSSPDRHQKDLTLAEVREDQGVTTQLEKRYTYRITAVDPAIVPANALPLDGVPQYWELRANPAKTRHIFVRKSRDSRGGTDRFTYKIVGSFYAVHGGQAYLVVYRHILHMAICDQVFDNND